MSKLCIVARMGVNLFLPCKPIEKKKPKFEHLLFPPRMLEKQVRGGKETKGLRASLNVFFA